jgi:hypothetical protein
MTIRLSPKQKGRAHVRMPAQQASQFHAGITGGAQNRSLCFRLLQASGSRRHRTSPAGSWAFSTPGKTGSRKSLACLFHDE